MVPVLCDDTKCHSSPTVDIITARMEYAYKNVLTKSGKLFNAHKNLPETASLSPLCPKDLRPAKPRQKEKLYREKFSTILKVTYALQYTAFEASCCVSPLC